MAQRIVDHTVNLDEVEKNEKKSKKKQDKALKKLAGQENTEVVESTEDNQADTTSEESTPAKAAAKKAKGPKKTRGAKYTVARKSIEQGKEYEIVEAISLLKTTKYTKFKESVEVHVNLGIDPKNSDQRIRFTTTLPHGIGKEIRILVISEDNSGKKGSVIRRDETVIQEIVDGKMNAGTDFDTVVSTPAKMKDIAKAAKILGPKGMMPTPKAGTVTDNIDSVIENLSKGQLEVRSQAGHAVLHQIIGNVEFKDEQLIENFNQLITDVNNNNPGKLKKKLIQQVVVTTTMSPSVKIKV